MSKKEIKEYQVEYLGRWIDPTYFSAFVYTKSSQKLVKSYQEYLDNISSGIWFPSRDEAINPPILADLPEVDEDRMSKAQENIQKIKKSQENIENIKKSNPLRTVTAKG